MLLKPTRARDVKNVRHTFTVLAASLLRQTPRPTPSASVQVVYDGYALRFQSKAAFALAVCRDAK
jgi:hypothetical protein